MPSAASPEAGMHMRNQIYDQLARTNLLPGEQSAQMLAGSMPGFGEIVIALLIGAMDAEAVIACDPQSSWNERRVARLCLILAFLLGVAVAKD
jgi:hypothetical protein